MLRVVAPEGSLVVVGSIEMNPWWGPLARHPGRTARILAPGRSPVEVTESMADPHVPLAGGIPTSGWLYEPDKALTQAGLLGIVTATTRGQEVERGLGYVLADVEADLPYARRYAVLEAMPFTAKGLRGWLRERGVTGLTIKKRGIRLDEDTLRRELRVGRKAGDGASATVVLTRVAGKQAALIVELAS